MHPSVWSEALARHTVPVAPHERLLIRGECKTGLAQFTNHKVPFYEASNQNSATTFLRFAPHLVASLSHGLPLAVVAVVGVVSANHLAGASTSVRTREKPIKEPKEPSHMKLPFSRSDL